MEVFMTKAEKAELKKNYNEALKMKAELQKEHDALLRQSEILKFRKQGGRLRAIEGGKA